MSLKVGTLVITKNTTGYPEAEGRYGEIVEELRYMLIGNPRTGTEGLGHYYGVLIPSMPSPSKNGVWYASPDQVIPITPPNGEQDVNDYVPDVNTVKQKVLEQFEAYVAVMRNKVAITSE